MRIALILLAALLTGCSTCPRAGAPERPAPINHIVFAKLKDPGQTQELLADCDARLAAIPSIRAFHAGTRLDTGRETVIADYDVALSIFFDDEAGYAAYVEHPDHVELVRKWQPRLVWLHIYDVLDTTP